MAKFRIRDTESGAVYDVESIVVEDGKVFQPDDIQAIQVIVSEQESHIINCI